MWVVWKLLAPHKVILHSLNPETMPMLVVITIPMTQMEMTATKGELVIATIIKVQLLTGTI